MFRLTKNVFQSVFSTNSKLLILLTLLCSSTLWWQASHWYESYLLEQQSVRIKQDLNQHATKLSSLVHKRFALLQGLTSFVETAIVQDPKLSTDVMQKAETFISGLLSSTEGIRNFAIAPGGTINYVSPLTGNEQAIGHALLQDPSPNGRKVSLRAIDQRTMALTDPVELLQGELGLVARQAVFSSGELWGLVSMVIDVMPVLREAGLFETAINTRLQLRDREGQIFFGTPEVFKQNTDPKVITQRVDLPDGYWELAATPVISNQSEITQQLIIFQITLAAILILLMGLFLAQHKIQHQTVPSIYQQKKPAAGSTPTWISPALTSASVILATIAFNWFMQRSDVTIERQNINNTAASLNQNLQQRLEAHREYLQLLAEQIAHEQLDPESFQTRAARYVNDHPGLINITWADSQFVIRHTAPYLENKQVIGLKLSLPEPERASRLAKSLRAPVYTKPFVVIQGKPAFELYVAIYKNDQFLGTLGAVYGINHLMDGFISDSLRSLYKIELLDTSGELIYTDSTKNAIASLTKSVPITPLQEKLWLRISAYEKGPDGSMRLLLLLSILLSSGIAYSLWQQYRESCRHWRTGESLRESQQHFRAIAEASPMAIVITHRGNGVVLYANVQANKLFAPKGDSLVGDKIQRYCSQNIGFHQKFVTAIKEHGHVDNLELMLKKGDGSKFWASISSQKVYYDQDTAIITSISDLTERKRYEDQLFKQANFDNLTGLPNRGLAFDRLQLAINRAKREDFKVALILLDLDHFKSVNDSLGHSAGDQLLNLIAGRMRDCVRNGDTVARLGGDEFTLILPELTDAMEARLIAQKIITACTTPLLIEGHEVHLSASIGITIYPDDGKKQEILLNNADTAMYMCKKQGRNHFRFYTDQMNEQSKIKLQMELELRRALEKNEFTLYYQPLISPKCGKVEGAEALLRWSNPALGQVPPSQFIPLAESIGIINDLGKWVLRTACKQLKEWLHIDGMPQYVSVNVSGNQLRQGELVETVSEMLSEFDLPPSALELEITESILLDNTENNRETLERIHATGIRLAIDDFGTGYSSLSYLRRFPFDTLKIDRTFIKDVPEEDDAAQLVSAIISMANILGLKIVAEGVENQQQLDFITERNCSLTQGFFLARPMSGKDIAKFVSTMGERNL